MSRRRPYWPWGIGLDKRQARRLRRRMAHRPIYATSARHTYKSADGGRTWTQMDPMGCSAEDCETEEHGDG